MMRGAGEANEGVFVVLEGIDGSGTTTQAARYAAHLRAQRRLVHVTHEPSSGPIGAQIRLVLRQRLVMPATHQAEMMALLFAADRLDHMAAEVDPLLRDGYVVLSDRYDLSSLTYQSITAAAVSSEASVTMGGDPPYPPAQPVTMGGDPPYPPAQPVSQREAAGTVEWIRSLNRFARRPHVTVVLDVSPDVAAGRRRARGGVMEIYEEADLQVRLGAAYRRAEDLVPGDRVIHVDGDRDPDTVAAAIIEALEPFVSSRAAPILR